MSWPWWALIIYLSLSMAFFLLLIAPIWIRWVKKISSRFPALTKSVLHR